MRASYQINDQTRPYFFTFQVVGWAHENHAIELSDNQMIDSRVEYIHQNPVRAGWVDKPYDYLYSSARNYSGLPGIIEVDLI